MRPIALLLALVLSTTAVGDGPSPELTRDNFDRWRKVILPSSKELNWRKIPWRSTFWDGVVDAQASDKPLLIWAMNGHPLACT
jgi:hypothetical protein